MKNIYKIGDYVTRKKYNNDIIFRIEKINNNIALLYGIDLRICADAFLNDLTLTSIHREIDEIENVKKIDINKYFYLPGFVLHIDSDKNYFEKCSKFYKKNDIKFIGYILDENEMEDKISKLILNHLPDIIVITGHDSYNKKNKYKNSKYFINTVKKIRSISKEIIIIAGACQSDFIGLMKAGSTFASSPEKKNIHALDPAIIATSIAFCNNNETINIEEILNKTKYGSSGIGGIIVKGKMKQGYPRIKE